MNYKFFAMFAVMTISATSQAFGSCKELLNAAYEGNLPAVKKILEAGTNPNCAEDFLREAGSRRFVEIGRSLTPLHAAVLGPTCAGFVENCLNIIKLLLQQGAQVNTSDARQYTAVHHALFAGNYEALATLVSAGAILTKKDKGFRTPEELARVLMKDDPKLSEVATTLKMWQKSYKAFWVQVQNRYDAYYLLNTYNKKLPDGSIAFWQRVDPTTGEKREGDEEYGYHQIFHGTISDAELASQKELDKIRVPLKEWTIPSTQASSLGFWTETKNRQSALDFLKKNETTFTDGSVAFWQRMNPDTYEQLTGSEAIGYYKNEDGKIAGPYSTAQKFVDEIQKSLPQWIDRSYGK